jgi:hypothetical protein
MPRRLPVAGLLLLVPPCWRLHPLDRGKILARREPAGGIIQIASVPRDRLPPDPSYDECMTAARQSFDPEGVIGGFDTVMLNTATGPLGGASFHKGKDFLRAWYCLRPSGLIFGVYSCAWELRTKPDWQLGAAECEGIIATAVFDRPLGPPADGAR